MVISQFGKIIRIDTKTIRAAGRATQGVRLLNLEPDDKVAAAVIIPPEELNGNGNHDRAGHAAAVRDLQRGSWPAMTHLRSVSGSKPKVRNCCDNSVNKSSGSEDVPENCVSSLEG